jgi:hypothetical protein
MKLKKVKEFSFWLIICLAFLITGGYGLIRAVNWVASPLVINEFVASNDSGVTDEDGDYSDWVEIYNRSNQPVNLSGWFLTNNPNQPDKWPFPDVVLNSHDYLVVFASGKNRIQLQPGGALHTNFKLSRQGEYLALYNVLENRLADIVSYQGDHFPDISFGHSPGDQGLAYLVRPTPGEANAEVLAWVENLAPAAGTEPELAQASFGSELTPAPSDAAGQPALGAASQPGLPNLASAETGDQQPTNAPWNLAASSPSVEIRSGYQLRITEIMYHPLDGDDYEFIELKNSGDQPIELAGASFEGVNFVFPYDAPLLLPDELLVLVRNEMAFAERYPNVFVSGIYDGHLSNQGEEIILRDYNGQVISSVAYDDENNWPMTPDGWGDSLVLVDPQADPNDPRAWRASSRLYGLPGDNELITSISSRQACAPLNLEESSHSPC